jgi:CRISPR-associated protein Cas2
MYLLLIYDIPNDRDRGKIATACLDYGLDRIQYSSFYGQLTRTHQEELIMKIENILDTKPGNVVLVPVATPEWNKRIEVGDGIPNED